MDEPLVYQPPNVGDIQPCPNWYHEEDCDECRKGRTREQLHAECAFCEGSCFVRVVAVEPGGETLAPHHHESPSHE